MKTGQQKISLDSFKPCLKCQINSLQFIFLKFLIQFEIFHVHQSLITWNLSENKGPLNQGKHGDESITQTIKCYPSIKITSGKNEGTRKITFYSLGEVVLWCYFSARVNSDQHLPQLILTSNRLVNQCLKQISMHALFRHGLYSYWTRRK